MAFTYPADRQALRVVIVCPPAQPTLTKRDLLTAFQHLPDDCEVYVALEPSGDLAPIAKLDVCVEPPSDGADMPFGMIQVTVGNSA